MPRTDFFSACALLALFEVACANSPSDLPPLPDTATGSFLAVAASDFSSMAALYSVDLANPTANRMIDKVDTQPVVRVYGNNLYVLDQTHGAMRTYDLSQNFQNPTDSPIGKMPEVPAAQANPYDIYVDAKRQVAYVTLYGSYLSSVITGDTALGVIDLTNPAAGIARFVPLPVAAGDPDNNPDATRLVGCGDTLLVLLQDLDRTNFYAPLGPGRLALVNMTNNADVSIVQLAGQNPTALTAIAGCNEAIVGTAGNQLTGTLSTDSGIERVDLINKQTFGLALSGSDLGGNVSTLDAVNSHDVFVAVSSLSGKIYNNDVYVVDAMASTHSQKLLGPMSFVPAVRVVAGQLVVLSGSPPENGQLRTGLFIGPANGTALPITPIDLGLPPISADLYTR